MHKVERSALVPFSAQDMFALVNDIERYPDFLPWCKQTHIMERTQDVVVASIHVSKGVFNKSFTTRNALVPDCSMRMELVDGPFERFHALWQFEALEQDACRVIFSAEFRFSNRMLDMTLSPIFNRIANTMLDAFCERAHVLHGAK